MFMLSEKEILKNRKMFREVDRDAVTIFKALSDVNRYRIFCILVEWPKLSVGTIAKIMHISLPLTSQHIKMLVHAKLLQKERVGKRIFSKLEYSNPLAQCIVKTVKQIVKIKRLE